MGAEFFQFIGILLGSGGAFVGLVSIWNSRHTPLIEKQKAVDATKKNDADVFMTYLQGLEKIIQEYREAREADRKEHEFRLELSKKFRIDLEERLEELESRVQHTEERNRHYETIISSAIIHIKILEHHINEQMPPPAPDLPPLLELDKN